MPTAVERPTQPLTNARTARREEPSARMKPAPSRLPALTLTWKIFLGTALVVAAVLGAVLLVTSQSAKAAADKAVDRTLSTTSDQVQTLLSGRTQALLSGARTWAGGASGNFRTIIQNHDTASYLDQAIEANGSIGASWVQITDAEGVRLAKSDDSTAAHDTIAGSKLIADALSGEVSSGIGITRDNVLFQAVSVPITQTSAANAQVLGALMAAKTIDNGVADSVKAATDGDVVFYGLDTDNKPHVVASTLARTPELEAFLAQRAAAPKDSATSRTEVKLAGQHYVGQSAELNSANGHPLGGFMVLRSRDLEMAGYNKLRTTILLGGALGILVAFLLSYIIAHQITRPVNALVLAARAAADGDYSADIPVRSRDEIGSLATAFRALLADLRDKQSLVELLSGSGDQGKTIPMQQLSMTGQVMMEEMAANLQPGTTFAGRYDVKEILGVGGMGMVFKAVDRELGEVIAIKTLKQEMVSQDPSALDRFRDEIRLARRISHRNVVRTHDIGEKNGVYYITMEYVEGTPLKDLIRARGRLPVSAVLTIGKQLCRALETAHEQGVIHRDIKPQNIVLEADGVLKVMDFGIARLAQRTSGMTQAGMVIGTPEYMAPEQLLGDDVDPRVDLYAAGAVLYECLTGRLPFEADSPIQLITKVLETTPEPPSVYAPDVPPALSALVLRVLSRDRDARPRTAGEMHDLIAQIG